MTAPATKAALLTGRYSELLADRSKPVDPFTLRRIVQDCDREIDAADSFGRTSLFTLKGLALLHGEQLHAAVDAFRNALKYAQSAMPPDARYIPINNLAAALNGIGSFREAIDLLTPLVLSRAGTPLDQVQYRTNKLHAHFRLGEVEAARRLLHEAVSFADMADPNVLLVLAAAHARIGAEDDAAEFFARALLAAKGLGRDERPAVEVIQALEPDGTIRRSFQPVLDQAVDAVIARYHEEPPDEFTVVARVALAPEARAKLDALSENPPEPTNALRELLHERAR